MQAAIEGTRRLAEATSQRIEKSTSTDSLVGEMFAVIRDPLVPVERRIDAINNLGIMGQDDGKAQEVRSPYPLDVRRIVRSLTLLLRRCWCAG